MKRFECPACGASMKPSSRPILTCPHCGTHFENNFYSSDRPEADSGSKTYEETFEENKDIYLDDACIRLLAEHLKEYQPEIDGLVWGTPIQNHPMVSEAVQRFHIPEGDDVYFIYGDTLSGNGSCGFALTTSGMHFPVDAAPEEEGGMYTWDQFIELEIDCASQTGMVYIGDVRVTCPCSDCPACHTLGTLLIGFQKKVRDYWLKL